MPYFRFLPFLITEQYGEGGLSRVFIFGLFLLFIRIFVLCLLFSLWDYVEHNQPLFRLDSS